jgi:hypothetical protein
MNTRRLLVTGIGLAVLAGGCATDAEQARRRFEVSPTGVSDPISDGVVARRRPQPPYVEGPVDAVQTKVDAARQALADATPPRKVPLDPPEAPVAPAPPAAAPPAAPPMVNPAPPTVEWLNPDRFSLSTPTEAAPPASAPPRPVSPPAIPAPGGDAIRVPADSGATAANQATQIPHPPAAVPATPAAPSAPMIASAQIPATPGGDPAFPSLTSGISATVVADPDPLGTRFAQRMRDFPTDLSAHLDYQLLRFLHDEQVPQLDTISTLPGEDRDLLTAVMDGMTNFRAGLRTNRNMLLSEKVKPILDLADRVRSQAELTIPVIAICSRVQGFGVYDPMPTTLRVGIDNPVIIYCEVGNFSSQQDEKGLWETKLSQEAVLYTDTGYPAWRDKSDIPLDLSRNRRHDFFVVKKVVFPRTLNIGRYNLKVSIVDEQVKRIAENSVPIELLAQ